MECSIHPQWSIGNGTKALFWEDWWTYGLLVREIAPLLYECIPKRRNRTVDAGLQLNSWVRDIQGVLGVHDVSQYLQLWQLVQHINLTEEPDRWRWTWQLPPLAAARPSHRNPLSILPNCFRIFFDGRSTSSWCIGIAPNTDLTNASLPGFCISLDLQVGNCAAILSTMGCSCAAMGLRIASGTPR
jgi:hypothetical protein